jgi:beta-N-acetylhexosaminidase
MRATARAALIGAAALGIALAGALPAWGWGVRQERAAVAAAGLSDAQLAGLRIATGFDGTHPPAELRRMISAGQVGGVILFDDNVGGRASVRALTSELQSIPRPAEVTQPLLVMVDQEGGLVRRLPGPPRPSAEEVGARGSRFAKRLGKAAGGSLRSMGVNVDLAPVLDVGRPGRAIEREHRTYGRTPKAVSQIGGAFARGLAAGGVAATAKHFPGLGAARVNTDNAVQRIGLSAAKLRRVDERPYGRFIASGGALVMLSTAIYPALSDRPAALSREIATGELRDRLGFAGVSITDSLGGAAAQAFGGPARSATAAAAAGTDIALFTDLGQAQRAEQALEQGLAGGSLPRAEFEASAARVLALRGGP